jgi:hypothetical protein
LPIFRAIVTAVQSRLPRATTAKGIASLVFRIWEKMHVQPPDAVATVALLLVYLFAAMLTIPWLLPFILHAARK